MGVQLNFDISVCTRMYDDSWVAVVAGLPIAAHADSELEADRRALDMLVKFLNYKDRKGELREYLDAKGVRYSEEWAEASSSRSYERRMSIPVGQ